jgi:uncharacterized protein with FMN-binding domain
MIPTGVPLRAATLPESPDENRSAPSKPNAPRRVFGDVGATRMLRGHPFAASLLLGVCLAGLARSAAAQNATTSTSAAKPSLQEALAKLKVPPDWFDSVKVNYDTTKPWKDARLEVRRLLGLGGDSAREAIKITYMYKQKNDIGNGHEYPMYLFMGGEYAWAIPEHVKFLAATTDEDTHSRLCFAACYRHFGESAKAIEVLNVAMERLPGPPWRIAREADVHDVLGDVYADMGDLAQARQHYEKAVALYPTSNQPFGRQELHRRAAKVQAKVDLLDRRAIESGQLRDGIYAGKSLGYNGDVELTVTIKSGKIADIQVKHEEKIDLGATVIIPERIIAKQSLKVDGISGATVTYDALVDAAFQALKKAGLK